MRKYLILLVIFSFTLFNCEKDDICIETTTPKLIIVFNNNDTPAAKKEVTSLTVYSDSLANLYENQSIDSIAIPLNLAKNSTLYKFMSGTKIDSIKFTYDRRDVFVSRSCGYKTIFENFQIESRSANWIKNDTLKNTTIDNETAVHLIIFH